MTILPAAPFLCLSFRFEAAKIHMEVVSTDFQLPNDLSSYLIHDNVSQVVEHLYFSLMAYFVIGKSDQ